MISIVTSNQTTVEVQIRSKQVKSADYRGHWHEISKVGGNRKRPWSSLGFLRIKYWHEKTKKLSDFSRLPRGGFMSMILDMGRHWDGLQGCWLNEVAQSSVASTQRQQRAKDSANESDKQTNKTKCAEDESHNAISHQLQSWSFQSMGSRDMATSPQCDDFGCINERWDCNSAYKTATMSSNHSISNGSHHVTLSGHPIGCRQSHSTTLINFHSTKFKFYSTQLIWSS